LLARIEHQLVELGVSPGSWPINIVVGRPGGALREIARRDDASLLLVGMQSRITLGRLFAGSTALGAAKDGWITVLAVDPQATALPSCAVVGTKFGQASSNAARAALTCMGASGSLHLVHARSLRSQIGPGALSADAAYAQEVADRLYGMAEWLRAPAGVRVECHALSGDPATRLVEVARQERADLIAVGAHGRGGFGAFLIGTTASRVLGARKSSVLIASANRLS
jgi:nucleotide-binding universal stress UspA family protein